MFNLLAQNSHLLCFVKQTISNNCIINIKDKILKVSSALEHILNSALYKFIIIIFSSSIIYNTFNNIIQMIFEIQDSYLVMHTVVNALTQLYNLITFYLQSSICNILAFEAEKY